MTLPFSREEFFSVFADYNATVWPAQLALYLLALVAIALAFRKTIAATRVFYAVMAVLWGWMGIVYHATFFSRINPLAVGFAGMFMIQSLLFSRLALSSDMNAVVPRNDTSGWGGALLVTIALILYPLMSVIAGHRYPAQPTFGVPCPTTVFTLGLLLWKADTAPKYVWVIPVLWAFIGTAGARQLGVVEDISLAVAFVVCAAAWAIRTMPREGSGNGGQRIRETLIVGERG